MKSVCLIVTAEVSALTFYRGYVRFLAERGWNVTVVAAGTEKLITWAHAEGGQAYNIPFVREPDPIRDLRSLWQLARLLHQLKPDVVVAATPKAGLLGTIASRLCGVPSRIYELWGLRLETERGIKRHVLALTERVAMMCSTQILANSASLRDQAIQLRLPGQKRIMVLGQGSSHGVNSAFFRRSDDIGVPHEVDRFRTGNTGLVIGFIGRLSRDKGIDTLLQAVSRCVARGNDVRLLVVGSPENLSTAEQVDQAVACGWALRIDEAQDIRGYLMAIDVLCLPTLREGFPNIVLEAACLEIPAIVSDATGAIDSVVDQETGWVFPSGDSVALADRISWMLGHRAVIGQAGQAARQRAVRDFSQSRVWDLKDQNLNQELAQ